MQDKQVRVTNKSAAKKSYKHILWFGEYMMFEFDKGQMKFGVGSYKTYSQCVKIDDHHTPGDAIGRIQSAIQQCSGAPFCLMMKTDKFLNKSVYQTLLPYTPRPNPEQHNEDVEFLQIYEEVMQLFVHCYIKKLFQESVEYVERRFEDFRGFHRDLFPEDSLHARSVVSKCLTSLGEAVPTQRPSWETEIDCNTVVPPIARPDWDLLKRCCVQFVRHLELMVASFTYPSIQSHQIPFFSRDEIQVRRVLAEMQSILQRNLCGRLQRQFAQPLAFLTLYMQDATPNSNMTSDLLEAVFQIVRIIETVDALSRQ